MKIFFCTILLLSLNIFSKTQASIVGVVDTGVDINHVDLAPTIWFNPVDLANNAYDEDNNGFLNDINGWNFSDNNGKLLDSKYISYLTPDVKRFFKVQSDAAQGNIDRASYNWAIKQLDDENFVKSLNTYANFMHGTHVAGIAIKDTEDAELLGVRVGVSDGERNTERRGSMWRRSEIRQTFLYMAKVTVDYYAEIIDYLDGHSTDVANLSIGINASALEDGMAEYLSPRAGDISDLLAEALDEFIVQGTKAVARAPETLFVVAAGNDGTDNDKLVQFPANIDADNVITVAATHEDKRLASFSNYGRSTVHIAAPGVDIHSTVPGNEYLSVSGTSQATPFVTRAASMVQDSNPSLTPAQIKRILMETVTKKSFLRGKIASGGVLHQDRAVHAAELSNTVDLDEAIARSLREVADPFVGKNNGTSYRFGEVLKELVLPLAGLPNL